ncbi:MAG TPA: nucleotidyltransferase family protein [Candidatus Binatia bacterium]|jgi:molybdenum cofactor cytidylyltransferase
MIAAVVLAAGESSRMGSPKALLPIDGETFIERIVGVLKQTQIGEVVIVLGHNAAELKPRIKCLPAEILINPDYKLGQLSSLQVAVRRLRTHADCDGMLVHLVDHPYLKPALVDEMIQRFYDSKKLIVVPRCGGKRGHPVIFSLALFDELLNAPMDQGAKAVVNAHRGETLELETDEAGITVDIDTPELYRQHVKGV